MVWALGQTAGPPLYSATPAPPASAGTLAAYQQALSAGFYRYTTVLNHTVHYISVIPYISFLYSSALLSTAQFITVLFYTVGFLVTP